MRLDGGPARPRATLARARSHGGRPLGRPAAPASARARARRGGAPQRSLDRVERSLDGAVDQAEREIARGPRRAPTSCGSCRPARSSRRWSAPCATRAHVGRPGRSLRSDGGRACGSTPTCSPRVRDALLHVVRNAVAHGIEPRGRARDAGKAAGRARRARGRSGAASRVAFVCRDDGRGIDVEAVRARGHRARVLGRRRSRGDRPDADPAARRSRAASPRPRTVTELSGRGIGLDVVRTTVGQLKGEVTAHAASPAAARPSSSRVPLSLSSLVGARRRGRRGRRARAARRGAPDAAARRRRTSPASATVTRSSSTARSIPFVPLGARCSGGRPRASRGARGRPSSSRPATGSAAVGVDRLLGTVQPGPAPAARRPRPRPDRRRRVARRRGQSAARARSRAGWSPRPTRTRGRAGRRRRREARPPDPHHRRLAHDAHARAEHPRIGRLRRRAGDVAEEGLDKAHASGRYGLFLVDVEMPGMDGFEFVARTRADPVLRDVPAILVTSRDAPEDRRRGEEAGAQRLHRQGRVRSGQLLADDSPADRVTDGKIRVLVVEDSLTVRRRLVEVLARRSGGRGRRRGRGRQARDRAVPRAAPDVVTLDMMLPVHDRARRHRVHHGALPDADPDRLGVDQPRRALQDVRRARRRRGRRAREAARRRAATAPGSAGSARRSSWSRASRSSPTRGPARRVAARPGRLRRRRSAGRALGAPPAVVAIGASTGGPAALVECSRALPRSSPLPIVLVLHIGEPFGAAFADWLDGQSPQRVAYARDGEPSTPSRAGWRMAPPDRHLPCRGRRLRLDRRTRAPLVPAVGRRALRVARARVRGRRRRVPPDRAWAATAPPACSRSGRPVGSRSRRTRATSRRLRDAARGGAPRRRGARAAARPIGRALAALAGARRESSHDGGRPHRRRQLDGPDGSGRGVRSGRAFARSPAPRLAEARGGAARRGRSRSSSSTSCCRTATASTAEGDPDLAPPRRPSPHAVERGRGRRTGSAALETGADDYVGKPYDLRYVVARARELLGAERRRRPRPADRAGDRRQPDLSRGARARRSRGPATPSRRVERRGGAARGRRQAGPTPCRRRRACRASTARP